MTIRLGESQEEIDWLKHGFYDIDLLNEFTGHKKFEPLVENVTPAQYLKTLGVLSKQLLVSYGNYLNDSDLELLSENKVSLAYCPRVSDNLHNKKLDFEKVLKYFPNEISGLESCMQEVYEAWIYQAEKELAEERKDD